MTINKELIKAHFPTFQEPELLENIIQYGQFREIAEEDDLIRIGQYIKTVPLVISGVIKISREDEQGNEVFLYYLEGGNTCAMSLTCCMAEGKSNIHAIADEPTQLIAIPLNYMNEWIGMYPSWRRFIMMSYASRFQELLYTIDSITFNGMDQRIEKYLIERAKVLKSNVFAITHQQIAYDLNSSREAVSRILKKMETLGLIKLGRNKIELISK